GTLANVREHPFWRSDVRQGVTLPAGVLLALSGGRERAVRVHQRRHVRVGVVPPPHAHPGSRVEPEVLPGTPERLEADDPLVVLPPTASPAPVSPVDPASVDVAQVLADELV